MYGNVVTLGSTCGINGCQRVTITHKGGGDMDASATLVNDKELGVKTNIVSKAALVATSLLNPLVDSVITPKDNGGISVGFSLVCQTSQGVWEYLMVNEGEIVLINGEKVMVKRRV